MRVRDGRTVEITVDAGRVAFRRGRDAPIILDVGDRWVARDPVATVENAPPSSPPRKRDRAPAPPAPATPRAESGLEVGLREALAALDAHDPAAAARTLRDVVRNYPDNPRAEDAAYLLVVALQRAGDRDAASAAARAYLQRFPDGLRRAAVEPIAP